MTSVTVSLWLRIAAPTTALWHAPVFSFNDIGVDGGIFGFGYSDIHVFDVGDSGQHYRFETTFVSSDIGIQENFHSDTDLAFSYANWHHLLVAARLDGGPNTVIIYGDGQLINQNGLTTAPGDPAVAIDMSTNGRTVIGHREAGSGNSQFAMPTIQLADVQAWYGQFIDPRTASNFEKFVSITNGIGRPVNPATARTAFGTQTILFKGSSSQFSTNAGNGGTFTKSGTINNFTPTPSYT